LFKGNVKFIGEQNVKGTLISSKPRGPAMGYSTDWGHVHTPQTGGQLYIFKSWARLLSYLFVAWQLQLVLLPQL